MIRPLTAAALVAGALVLGASPSHATDPDASATIGCDGERVTATVTVRNPYGRAVLVSGYRAASGFADRLDVDGFTAWHLGTLPLGTTSWGVTYSEITGEQIASTDTADGPRTIAVTPAVVLGCSPAPTTTTTGTPSSSVETTTSTVAPTTTSTTLGCPAAERVLVGLAERCIATTTSSTVPIVSIPGSIVPSSISGSASTLPRTGASSPAVTALWAGLLLAAGWLLVRAGRRDGAR